MTNEQLIQQVKAIVADAKRLIALDTSQPNAPVNYACIFSQSDNEFEDAITVANEIGRIAHDTPTGPVFLIREIETTAGPLKILKIRRPDPKRPERGDADFTVVDYPAFKATHLGTPGFKLIERENMEMIELVNTSFDVLAYFSNPTLAEVLGIEA